jgi:outer membrane lipoprotein
VEWGGVIVGTHNLADQTQIQVLGYPLDGGGRPDLTATPHGRFLVLRSGFLEPRVYAPGRHLTVYGPIEAMVPGRIGQAAYLYPKVRAEQLQLWPRSGQGITPSNVQFGIGIGIGL